MRERDVKRLPTNNGKIQLFYLCNDILVRGGSTEKGQQEKEGASEVKSEKDRRAERKNEIR